MAMALRTNHRCSSLISHHSSTGYRTLGCSPSAILTIHKNLLMSSPEYPMRPPKITTIKSRWKIQNEMAHLTTEQWTRNYAANFAMLTQHIIDVEFTHDLISCRFIWTHRFANHRNVTVVPSIIVHQRRPISHSRYLVPDEKFNSIFNTGIYLPGFVFSFFNGRT